MTKRRNRNRRPPRYLRVTAILASPLAGDIPKLDAVVEWAMGIVAKSIETDSGGRHACGRKDRIVPGELPTPFEVRRVKGFPWPIPACSSGIADPEADLHDYYHKSLAGATADLVGERRIIDVGGGCYRSYRLPLRIRVCRRIVWFCEADAHDLRRRLRKIAYIGKKSAIGYGTVAEWQVEQVDEDYSWFAPSPKGPVLMRPLPIGDHLPNNLQGARPSFGGCVPPYWDPRYWTEIVEPC